VNTTHDAEGASATTLRVRDVGERDRAEILFDLRAAFDGQPWHGPSLAKVLSDVDPATCAEHPVAGAHSILELLLHLTAWTSEVTRRLNGAKPGEPEEGDWPAAAQKDPIASWNRARERLARAYDELFRAIENCPAERFDAIVGSLESPESPITVARMLRGAVQHFAYHSGQIPILRHALFRQRAPSA